MTTAVTAASGQLGGAVIRALAALDPDEMLIGLARTPANASGLNVEVRPGDYADSEQLRRSLEGVDRLLLISGNEPPDERIEQHRNVLGAAKAAGVARVVYTSIQGAERGTAFSPVVQSNRQTEDDLRSSGLNWVIARNGIYIEPDIEYIETYKANGEIANCAGDAKCAYTTRTELAHAYAHMLTRSEHDGQIYNLHGEPITQAELAAYLNQAFGTALTYRSMSVADYREERVAELGEFMGTIIAGIYEGIRNGALDNHSDFERVTGRPHQSWDEYFRLIQP